MSSNQFSRNVFVLDISGSMSGTKCQTLQLSATRFIEDIPDESYVGIVLFDTITELCHKVVQITDRSVRDALIRSVPAMARGGTNIGLGIMDGIQAFRDQNISTEGATMILVTDGGHCGQPDNYVDYVLPTLLSAKIKVVCIAIGNAADARLERLARETNGSTYSASGTNREMMARVIEATIQEVKTSKELAEAINISVCDDIIHLNQTKVTKNVTIDSDIGNHTVFTIGSEDYDKISICIQSPNGHKYDCSSSELIRNQALKRFQLKPSATESGIWSISLTKHSVQNICATISVKSQPLNPKAIQMRVTLKDTDSDSPPVIITEIRKGSDAIVGADVTATVDKPDGTQSELKLINFGNIYCNYFTEYCGSGRYNVSVLAQNKGSNCQLKSLSSRTSVGSIVPYFERQQIAGSFKVTDCMPRRPSDNKKLEELSQNSSFNSSSFASSVGDIQAPVPRTAKAVIKPKVRAVPQTDDIIKAKEKINVLLLLLKKSISSPKISESERNVFKQMMADIDSQMNVKTVQELNDYLKQLEGLQQKLF